MTHQIFLEKTGYHAKVTIDSPSGEPPYMSHVDYVFTLFEGWKVDITIPVVADEQACKRLEHEALQEYYKQQDEQNQIKMEI